MPLNHYNADVNPEDMTYAGSYMPPWKALQIALGNINIYTGERFADYDPDTFVVKIHDIFQQFVSLREMFNK